MLSLLVGPPPPCASHLARTRARRAHSVRSVDDDDDVVDDVVVVFDACDIVGFV